jgi:hypothetical protein
MSGGPLWALPALAEHLHECRAQAEARAIANTGSCATCCPEQPRRSPAEKTRDGYARTQLKSKSGGTMRRVIASTSRRAACAPSRSPAAASASALSWSASRSAQA